jgi:hypothetical protein
MIMMQVKKKHTILYYRYICPDAASITEFSFGGYPHFTGFAILCAKFANINLISYNFAIIFILEALLVVQERHTPADIYSSKYTKGRHCTCIPEQIRASKTTVTVGIH